MVKYKIHIIVLIGGRGGLLIYCRRKCSKDCNVPLLKSSLALMESRPIWIGMFKARDKKALRRLRLSLESVASEMATPRLTAK